MGVMNRLFEATKYFDFYSESFDFTLDKSKRKVKTVLGSILSIATVVTLALFAFLKYMIMIGHDDTNIMISNKEYFYNDTDLVSDRLGFNIAFGISDFDGSPLSVEDPSYGYLVAEYRSWGFADGWTTEYNQLSRRHCERSDFHLDEDPNRDKSEIQNEDQERAFLSQDDDEPFFFHPIEAHREWIETYHPKMYCFNDKLKIMGNYDTAKAQTLTMQFHRCNPEERECKSESEIDDYLRDKFFVVIENSWTFFAHQYGANERLKARS